MGWEEIAHNGAIVGNADFQLFIYGVYVLFPTGKGGVREWELGEFTVGAYPWFSVWGGGSDRLYLPIN